MNGVTVQSVRPNRFVREGCRLAVCSALLLVTACGKATAPDQGEVADASPSWAEHGDLVAFLIGCSFTFETPLVEAGIEIRHVTQGCNVPMYRTNRPCRSAGRLSAPFASTGWTLTLPRC